MPIVTLPTKRSLFTTILSDAVEKDECDKTAWDEAIKYALREYDEVTLEEIVDSEDVIKENLCGFTQGYMKALSR